MPHIPMPRDLWRDHILPFAYNVQPRELLADLLSYHSTMVRVRQVYQTLYPTTPETPNEESDRAWLSNDICRFLNDDQPTMLGYVPFYRDVFARLFMNHRTGSLRAPSFLSDNFAEIKVAIALLQPHERARLETFLTPDDA